MSMQMTDFRENVDDSSTHQHRDNILTEQTPSTDDDVLLSSEQQPSTPQRSWTATVDQRESNTNTPQQKQADQDVEKWTKMIRIGVGLALALSLVYVIMDSFRGRKVEAAILQFLDWVSNHPYQGVLAVIGVYIIATVLFVPGSLLTLGTGYAFGSACDSTGYGVFLASCAVFIGASLGSLTTFLLGRYLFRDCVLRLAATYPIFQAVDRALEGNGLKIMVLLRLSPLIPYNALDYMSGVTSISFGAYALALIGILPGVIMFCYVGATASSLADSSSTTNKTVQIITMVMGIFFAICGVYVASYYSKRELDRILAEDEHEREAMNFSLSNNNNDTHSYVDNLEQRQDVEGQPGVLT